MEACVMMAKEYMKRAGMTDLKIAKVVVESLVSFAKVGAEIGVAGESFKPDLETVLAIQKGLNKLIAIEKGTATPRKFFQPSWSDERHLAWESLPGKEQRQCSRCRHIVAPGEKLKQSTKNGITTSLCPRCLCESYYAFKYEVTR